eukprot:5802245-Pyramimonas_sp.AAC.2
MPSRWSWSWRAARRGCSSWRAHRTGGWRRWCSAGTTLCASAPPGTHSCSSREARRATSEEIEIYPGACGEAGRVMGYEGFPPHGGEEGDLPDRGGLQGRRPRVEAAEGTGLLPRRKP